MSYGIVIVDDEYWIRSLIRSYLPENDDRFTLLGEAEDGLEGLDNCRCLKPDIIITDIKMPGMSGLEMLQKLKQEYPGIQSIIISGYAEFEYARKALQNGAMDYLLKPIEKDSIYKLLCKAAGNLDKINQFNSIFSATGEVSSIKDLRINSAVEFIQRNYHKDISLGDAAFVAVMNQNYFSECFKKSLGQGFGHYLTLVRLREAAKLLQNKDLKIVEIAKRCGYNDPNYFTRIFKKYTGLNPSNCRIKRINDSEITAV